MCRPGRGLGCGQGLPVGVPLLQHVVEVQRRGAEKRRRSSRWRPAPASARSHPDCRHEEPARKRLPSAAASSPSHSSSTLSPRPRPGRCPQIPPEAGPLSPRPNEWRPALRLRRRQAKDHVRPTSLPVPARPAPTRQETSRPCAAAPRDDDRATAVPDCPSGRAPGTRI